MLLLILFVVTLISSCLHMDLENKERLEEKEIKEIKLSFYFIIIFGLLFYVNNEA